MLTLDPNGIELLRTLKGAPLSCLAALFIARRPVGRDWLVTATAYNKDTVTQAMRTLVDLGHAARVARYESWQLTDKGYQLPFFGTLKIEGENLAFPSLTTATTLTSDEFSLTSSSSSSKKNEGENLAFPQSEPEPESPEYLAALTSLHAHNIKGPKAALLASKEWMTPTYIHQHVAQARAEGKQLGLAIVRMEVGEEPRERCDECGEWDGNHSDLCNKHGQDIAASWIRYGAQT